MLPSATGLQHLVYNIQQAVTHILVLLKMGNIIARLPKIHKEGVPLRPIVSNIGAPTYQLSKHLAGLLGQLTGKSIHHVKNSLQFVQTLSSIRIQPGDLMVSFDIVSLYTNVPILDSLQHLSRHFDKDIISLFKHTLTSTYFCFKRVL